jgi:hypothetical protein
VSQIFKKGGGDWGFCDVEILGCSLVGLCVFSWRKYSGLGGGGGDPQLRDLLITRVTSSPTSNAAFEAVWEDEFLDHT